MAASVTPIPVPRLKDYVFTDKLGSGTYATVFKAYRKAGSREVVAVKCVQKKSLNKVATENLLTEIELLKTLRHENIVCLKDFQWDESYIYLIMEYCNGGDLSRFIRSQRTLSEYMAKRFLQHIALALQYMRTKNVSHMDLKPPNILLSSLENPVLKLGDFGFAHYLTGETDADFLRGSPLYMAPEIITKRQYNEKADLWSVGVIMYECLFGRAPFSSKSLTELHDKIKDTKPIELPYGVDVSSKCRDLLLGLLKRNPEERMDFDQFFNHPFVDLDHRPSSNSLEKATRLVTKAVQYDDQGEAQKAVDYYCKAMQHFVPAIHYEKDQRRKETLRSRVKQYMKRAEELKTLLKPAQPAHVPMPTQLKKIPVGKVPKGTASRNNTGLGQVCAKSVNMKVNNETESQEASLEISDNDSNEKSESANQLNMQTNSSCETASQSVDQAQQGDPYFELEEVYNDNVHLQGALTHIRAAHSMEEEEKYEIALEKYEIALEALLRIVKEEPKGKRRDVLQHQICDWMSRAERIKEYLNVKDLRMEDTSLEEEMEGRRFFSAMTGSCCIQ